MKILCMSELEAKTRKEFYIKMYWRWVDNTHKLNLRSRCKDPYRTWKF